MDESAAWIAQAAVDHAAAERERAFAEQSNPATWRHAVAKYQQAVEKFIKSIVAALREWGVANVSPVGYDHRVHSHLLALRRLPDRAVERSIPSKLKEFVDAQTKHSIGKLENLAPRKPAIGEAHSRNTEYPLTSQAAIGLTQPPQVLSPPPR